MKILTILGARPQFIKAGALSREFSKHNQIDEVIVHTGQHFDKNMSDVFFDEMEIPKPKYNLGINSLTHGAMTGRMIEEIEKILFKESPDLLLVYGDTNSTLAGALAAKKMHIPVAHVEAGLRSFNMKMPEEINRILTDRISDYLFCPTEQSFENLKKEGFDNLENKVVNVGDVMNDAVLFYSMKPNERNILKLDNDYILCTIHRQENTDDIKRLTDIISAINELSKSVKVLIPLHPRTKQKIKDLNIKVEADIVEPVGYVQMLNLIKNSRLVLTDSGGIQKEAYILKKYCVTLRNETEWVELINNGVNVLVGADKAKIISAVRDRLNASFNSDVNLYGGGTASKKIIDYLLSDFKCKF
ncbi:UDP-N-acetylglucosamine 2-epimerase (non-hydrolyzing) [Vicingus serpentipes]|uniref:UDP-N-acetylglucosamine 2-epimerase (Non-hydrolyzing) n=1 Tax=Vicingus serpentipes TaxID=1926625 RepID=A0A5C6RZW3_9FLAO|nr:UDP-N-acetylglucosamine 2-epimerase (non-hydrolyzing) [Vicingus serpentipes]TXB67259.1 UDP-N-acetylglucosamine 2-epimerase (non-hydrolyzing) [Vicingus serpentipes]